MFNSKKWRKRNSIDIIFLWRFLQVRITSEEASLFIFFYIKSKPEFSNPANAALSKQPNRLRLKRYSWNNGSYNSTDRGALLVTSGLSIPRSTAVSWTARFTRTRNVYGRRTCRALLIHTISCKNFSQWLRVTASWHRANWTLECPHYSLSKGNPPRLFTKSTLQKISGQ